MAGDDRKRAQLFLSFLSEKRVVRPPLYPILEKLRETSPLTNRDLTPLVNALCAALRKNGEMPPGHQQKLQTYIQTGAYDTDTMLWLALFVDPVFALHLWHDNVVEQLPPCATRIDHGSGMVGSAVSVRRGAYLRGNAMHRSNVP